MGGRTNQEHVISTYDICNSVLACHVEVVGWPLALAYIHLLGAKATRQCVHGGCILGGVICDMNI